MPSEEAPSPGGEKVTKVRRVKSKKSDKESPIARTVTDNVEKSAPVASPPLQQAAPSAPRQVSTKRRAQRSGSNVFAMFTQHQVQQFKEAFGFIDQDKDGIISKSDIRASFDALGRLCSDKELEEMVSEASGPINFTMFLTVFGERVQGTDDEEVILDAFSRYDQGDGFCKEEALRHALSTWGEKFTQQECDVALNEAPTNNKGQIDLRKFAILITRGSEEDENTA